MILTSTGGLAIYASPVTLPLLMLVAMNSVERPWRVAAAVVGALTILEVMWAATSQVWPNSASLAISAAVGALCLVGLLHSRKLVTSAGT